MATLEFVLALPILLFIMLLAYNVVLMSQTRLDAISNARLHAMSSSYGLDSALTTLLTLQTTAAGLPIITSSKPVVLSAPGDLQSVINSGPGDPMSRAQIFRAQSAGVLETTSHAPLFGKSALPLWNLDISDTYAVVAAPAWERADFPIGYDSYLNSDDLVFQCPYPIPGCGPLMPNAFPNAK